MSCSACIFNLSIGYLWVFVFVNFVFLCALKLGVCVESGSIQNGYFKVCLGISKCVWFRMLGFQVCFGRVGMLVGSMV